MAGVPNFAETYINAISAGRQQRKQQAQDQAFQMVGSDPQGAQNALLQAGDYQGAAAVGQIGAQQRKLKVQTDIAPMIQKGDFAGASNTAAAGGQFDVAGELTKLDAGQREKAKEAANAFATTAYGLAQIPLDQGPDPLSSRKIALQKVAGHLQQMGLTPDQIAAADLSDQGLKGIAVQALSVKDQITQQQQADTLAETKDYHKQSLQHETDVLKETKTHNRADEAAARQRAAGEGWQTLTDPGNGNQPFRYNARTGQATTLDGSAAYVPKAAAKLGSDSVRSPAMAALVKWKEENPNATADEIAQFGSKLKAQAKATSDFATGPQGKTINSINVGVDHLNTAQLAANALKNGNIQVFNKVAKDLQAATGKAAPTNFDAVKQIVADEVVKSVTGGAGGVGDREKAQAILSRVNSPDQLAGAITEIKHLMAGQLKGLRLQYKSDTGLDDFEEKKLLPGTRAELEGLDAAGGPAGTVVHYDAQGNRVK